MEQADFEKYLKERYNPEIAWYDSKSVWNQKIYRCLQWTTIVLSAATPVLIAIDFAPGVPPYFKWIPVATSTAVAILGSGLKTFKYQENWLNYRTICETLRKEIHLYRAKVDEYAVGADPQSLFVQRVESLISRENTLWLTTVQKQDEKEKS